MGDWGWWWGMVFAMKSPSGQWKENQLATPSAASPPKFWLNGSTTGKQCVTSLQVLFGETPTGMGFGGLGSSTVYLPHDRCLHSGSA